MILKDMHPSMARLSNRLRLADVADWLAVATAASLPWSTSATAIGFVLLLLALIPTLDWADVRRELLTAAGGLPVLLVAFGVLGMLWADVSLIERWKGLESFFKLLVIVLLFVHFRRSNRGICVLAGYLVSCILLLVITGVVAAVTPPGSWWVSFEHHTLVKSGATQSGEFVTCIFGMLYLAAECFEQRRWWWLVGLVAVMLGMLGNMFFVATGRTALVVIPMLLVLFAAKKLSRKGAALLFACGVVLTAAAWFASPYLRDRTTQLWTDYQEYRDTNTPTSSGQRVVFYENSIKFIKQAPIIGNGTGSIGALFYGTVADGYKSNNPHNQTFAVAIQLGLVGAAILWAMWIAHLMLFRGPGLAEWAGLVVVVQNIVGSLFNSHLFDFGQGWIYVLGVGVAGGMVLKKRDAAN
jgi:hypothetical protein